MVRRKALQSKPKYAFCVNAPDVLGRKGHRKAANGPNKHGQNDININKGVGNKTSNNAARTSQVVTKTKPGQLVDKVRDAGHCTNKCHLLDDPDDYQHSQYVRGRIAASLSPTKTFEVAPNNISWVKAQLLEFACGMGCDEQPFGGRAVEYWSSNSTKMEFWVWRTLCFLVSCPTGKFAPSSCRPSRLWAKKHPADSGCWSLTAGCSHPCLPTQPRSGRGLWHVICVLTCFLAASSSLLPPLTASKRMAALGAYSPYSRFCLCGTHMRFTPLNILKNCFHPRAQVVRSEQHCA